MSSYETEKANANGDQKQDEYVDGSLGKLEQGADDGLKNDHQSNSKATGGNDGDTSTSAGDKATGNEQQQQQSSAEKNEEMEKELAREDVCRDFLNNMCNRGSRCKFYHPPSIIRERASQQTPEGIEYQFCIDYQNRGCHRDNCRYIHAHREDVDRYKISGEVTLNLAREIAAIYNCDTINGIPFCKEYQTGTCSRGGQRCRYWHINVEEERERRRRFPRGYSASAAMLPPPPPLAGAPGYGGGGYGASYPVGSTAVGRRSHHHHHHPYGSGTDSYGGGGGGPLGKRMRYELDDDYIRELERRNAELSKEVEGLKRELMRERERYEDLYALFRQRTVHSNANAGAGTPAQSETSTGSAAAAAAAAMPAAAAYYQAASTGWTDPQWT